MYIPDRWETLSLFISLSCVTFMAFLFGRKTSGTTLGTLNYARGLVVALFLVSWGFSVIAARLVQTNNFNFLSCSLSILSCIALYALSKIIIYLFLMEKVYVVSAVGITWSSSFLYRVNCVLMTPYIGVVTCMVIFRIAYIQQDGECMIGLARGGALPLVLYDIFMSSWLTFWFLKPLMSNSSFLRGPSKGKLREVARRTLVGCIVALLLSSANIFSLVYFKRGERGLICLACCTVDVTLNAITIHWVTSSGSKSRTNLSTNLTTIDRPNLNGVVTSVHGYGRGRLTAERSGCVESHISVSVEEYVEEYHQLHYGGGGGGGGGGGSGEN